MYRSYQGSSLVETMVSLVLLAIGLLGMLSLQINGINSNQRAVFVNEAHFIGWDLIERMLNFGSASYNANQGANRYQYTNSAQEAIVIYASTDEGTQYSPQQCISSEQGCTPAESILHDKYQIQQALRNSSLPNSRLRLQPQHMETSVTVYWDRDRTGASDDGDCESSDKETYLTCFEIVVTLP